MDWLIGDVVTSSKGNNTTPITYVEGGPVFLQLTTQQQPLSTPCGASAYNDPTTTKKNICFRCTSELEQTISAIDCYMEIHQRPRPHIQTASFVEGRLPGATPLQNQHRRPTCREILDTYVQPMRPTKRLQGNCNHTSCTGAKLMDYGVGMWSLLGRMRYYVFNHRRHLPIRRHICLT